MSEQMSQRPKRQQSVKFTDEEIAIIEQSVKDGRKVIEIARDLGRSEDSVSQKLDRIRNWPEKPKIQVRRCIGAKVGLWGLEPCKAMIRSTGPHHRMCFDCRTRVR